MLGSALLQALIQTGHECKALTSDVRERDGVLKEVEEYAPDAIIHTAAITNIAECGRNPEKAEAVNAKGTETIVESARSVGARLIYISTVSVVSCPEGNVHEEDVPNPTSVYNKTKFEGEKFVRRYEKGAVVRLNLIGVHPKGSRGRSFVEWLIDSFRSNLDITLFTDQRINPLSNWTVSKILIQLLERPEILPILHVGSHDVLSKADIGRMVLSHFPEYTGKVSYAKKKEEDGSLGQPTEMWLNIEKAESLLERMPSLESEVELIFNSKPFL